MSARSLSRLLFPVQAVAKRFTANKGHHVIEIPLLRRIDHVRICGYRARRILISFRNLSGAQDAAARSRTFKRVASSSIPREIEFAIPPIHLTLYS